MSRPEFFNLTIDVHDYKFGSANSVFQRLRHRRHVLVGVDDYRGDIGIFERQAVGHSPLPFMREVEAFREFLPGIQLLLRWRGIFWSERSYEGPKPIIEGRFRLCMILLPIEEVWPRVDRWSATRGKEKGL